jgi:spoIIIJ-associated protein
MKNFNDENRNRNETKTFEAKSLEEAYELACSDFKCSITELNIDIVQQPSGGLFGLFGKKNALIEVSFQRSRRKEFNKSPHKKKFKKNNIKIEDVSTTIAKSTKEKKEEKPRKPSKPKHDFSKDPKIEKDDKIFDSFYETSKDDSHAKIIVKKDKDEIVKEIKEKVNSLFSKTCYALDEIEVNYFDDETLYIQFGGEDAALLIGKEGYRYKALSYVLFNWINEKYGLMLRLEVAEFLKNQEESISNYLGPVIENIKENGSAKTKPLDGILVHIALKILREEFPEKYVAVKTNNRGDRYILVNEYRSNNSQ